MSGHPTGWAPDAFKPGWTLAPTPAPCRRCRRPAWCVDPKGRPRHRVDCVGQTCTVCGRLRRLQGRVWVCQACDDLPTTRREQETRP